MSRHPPAFPTRCLKRRQRVRSHIHGNTQAKPPPAVVLGKGDTSRGKVLRNVLVPLKPKTRNNFLGCFGRSGNVHCPSCDLNNPGTTALDEEVSWNNDLRVYKVRRDIRFCLTLEQLGPDYIALNWLTRPPPHDLYNHPPSIVTTGDIISCPTPPCSPIEARVVAHDPRPHCGAGFDSKG